MFNIGRRKTETTPIFAILLDKIYFWFNPENKSGTLHAEKTKEYQINPVTERIIKSLDVNKVIIVNRDHLKLPQEFQNLCLKNDLKYFYLSEKLNLMKKIGNDPNEWEISNKSGHWNQKAHKVVGEAIARKLIDIIE
ncbi:MAG: hypothetical protein WD431_12965 [Cyclobacteriaceae bacterium]